MRHKIFLTFALILMALPFAAFAQDTGSGLVGDQACLECHEDFGLKSVGNIHSRLRSHELGGVRMGCEACHGPGQEHMEEADPTKIVSFTNLSADAASQACLRCHQAIQTADWNMGDHALNEVGCTDCHNIHDEDGLVKPEPQLCFDCHTEMKVKSHFPSRHPVREGKMTCSSCHQHHGSLVNNLKTTERLNLDTRLC